MNKPLSAAELQSISVTSTAIKPHVMTRREKLQRFAKIVRESNSQFFIFHQLEYLQPGMLESANHSQSAFHAAATDPILADAGLKDGTVGSAMKFFELGREDLHEFSCNCGGHITNSMMADRIDKIAMRGHAAEA